MSRRAASQGPQQGQPVFSAGKPLEQAQAVLLLIHGRGGTAQSILQLADELHHADFAYLAPQAAGNTWYPHPFLAPIEQNEPWLSSGLNVMGELLRRVDAAGIPAERVIIAGFSQGACLGCEFVARNARRYGGLVVLSGGLIGPPGTTWAYPGSLDGAPVFLGCSNPDPHIPRERVEESVAALQALGGAVTARLYPDLGHTINQDELDHGRRMMRALVE